MRAGEGGAAFKCFMCRTGKIQGHRMFPFNSDPDEFSKEPIAKFD